MTYIEFKSRLWPKGGLIFTVGGHCAFEYFGSKKERHIPSHGSSLNSCLADKDLFNPRRQEKSARYYSKSNCAQICQSQITNDQQSRSNCRNLFTDTGLYQKSSACELRLDGIRNQLNRAEISDSKRRFESRNKYQFRVPASTLSRHINETIEARAGDPQKVRLDPKSGHHHHR